MLHRFNDLLHRRDALQRWYEFENRAVDEALCERCEAIGVQPAAGKPRVLPNK